MIGIGHMPSLQRPLLGRLLVRPSHLFHKCPAPGPGRQRKSVGARASSEQVSPAQLAAIAAGFVFNPVVLYSDFVLKTTGKGLPPGPGGLYGAAEGIGFLVVFGIVGWSLATKVQTGSGLPAGPGGALGGVEGLSYLTVLATVLAFLLTFLERGSLPGVTG